MDELGTLDMLPAGLLGPASRCAGLVPTQGTLHVKMGVAWDRAVGGSRESVCEGVGGERRGHVEWKTA